MHSYRFGQISSILIKHGTLKLYGLKFQFPHQVSISSCSLVEFSDLRWLAVRQQNRFLNYFTGRIFAIRTLKINAESVTELWTE